MGIPKQVLNIAVFCAPKARAADAKKLWRVFPSPNGSVATFPAQFQKTMPHVPSPGHQVGACVFLPCEIMLSLPLAVKHFIVKHCSSICTPKKSQYLYPPNLFN